MQTIYHLPLELTYDILSTLLKLCGGNTKSIWVSKTVIPDFIGVCVVIWQTQRHTHSISFSAFLESVVRKHLDTFFALGFKDQAESSTKWLFHHSYGSKPLIRKFAVLWQPRYMNFTAILNQCSLTNDLRLFEFILTHPLLDDDHILSNITAHWKLFSDNCIGFTEYERQKRIWVRSIATLLNRIPQKNGTCSSSVIRFWSFLHNEHTVGLLLPLLDFEHNPRLKESVYEDCVFLREYLVGFVQGLVIARKTNIFTREQWKRLLVKPTQCMQRNNTRTDGVHQKHNIDPQYNDSCYCGVYTGIVNVCDKMLNLQRIYYPLIEDILLVSTSQLSIMTK